MESVPTSSSVPATCHLHGKTLTQGCSYSLSPNPLSPSVLSHQVAPSLLSVLWSGWQRPGHDSSGRILSALYSATCSIQQPFSSSCLDLPSIPHAAWQGPFAGSYGTSHPGHGGSYSGSGSLISVSSLLGLHCHLYPHNYQLSSLELVAPLKCKFSYILDFSIQYSLASQLPHPFKASSHPCCLSFSPSLPIQSANPVAPNHGSVSTIATPPELQPSLAYVTVTTSMLNSLPTIASPLYSQPEGSS